MGWPIQWSGHSIWGNVRSREMIGEQGEVKAKAPDSSTERGSCIACSNTYFAVTVDSCEM